jgi:hypothetical protein
VNSMYCSRCMMVSCFPCTLLLSFWVLFVIPSCSPIFVPRGGGVSISWPYPSSRTVTSNWAEALAILRRPSSDITHACD